MIGNSVFKNWDLVLILLESFWDFFLFDEITTTIATTTTTAAPSRDWLTLFGQVSLGGLFGAGIREIYLQLIATTPSIVTTTNLLLTTNSLISTTSILTSAMTTTTTTAPAQLVEVNPKSIQYDRCSRVVSKSNRKSYCKYFKSGGFKLPSESDS